MALLVDAGPLYAQADRKDPNHRAIADVLLAEREPLVASPFGVAEADYLILSQLGVDVELAFLDDLASGTFIVESLSRDELASALEVARRYRDLELGLADASLVVLAHRYGTRRILTLDERAFWTVTPLQGGSFTILPADA